jgi:hypothetical protein
MKPVTVTEDGAAAAVCVSGATPGPDGSGCANAIKNIVAIQTRFSINGISGYRRSGREGSCCSGAAALMMDRKAG